MHYKYFFFDFDGMLCDSYTHTAKAFVRALTEKRNSYINELEAYNYLKISFNDAFNHFNVTEDEKILFKKYHEDINFKPVATLYLPIRNLLKQIINSGGKNFIYTNRNETLYEYLEKFEIKDLFTDIIIRANKPSPEPLIEMINKYNLDKSQCVVVGDRSLDVDGAYNAKIDGILYDVDSRVFMHRATHVIKHINQLYNFIDLPYKIKHNYHTHTARCGHAIGSDEEYIIKAIEAGYQTIGISDHIMIPDLNRNEEYFDSISLLKEKYKDARLIVVVDDIDLPRGDIRYRQHGSAGTHNGLRSIVSYIGQDFERIKVGAGRDISMDLADYVLSKFDREVFQPVLEKAAKEICERLS